MTLLQPKPLISEARARKVRTLDFDTSEIISEILHMEARKLEEIAQAEPSFTEVLTKQGVEEFRKACERLPVRLELVKELMSSLFKITSIHRSEAPLPGEAKHPPLGPAVESPHEPEQIDDHIVNLFAKLKEREREKKKAKRKPQAG
jgi:hypothetical protein